MAKESKEKTWWAFHEEIEQLKEKRATEWQKHLPAEVQELPPQEARMAVLKAENHPAVLAIAGEIAMLRAEQLAHHNEPEYADHNAHAGK